MEYFLTVRGGDVRNKVLLGRSSRAESGDFRRGRDRSLRFWLPWLFFAVAALGPGSLFASDEEEREAEMQVSGFGILGNQALERTLDLIRDPDAPPPFFSATQIEDAALLLMAQVREEGYLQPEVKAEVTRESGETETFTWDGSQFTELPRPMRAASVEFQIREGQRFFFEELTFEGLTVVEEEEATEYFIATGFLIETEGSRIFTPARLESGIRSLREILIGKGYEEAQVSASRVERDDETGEVLVTIAVQAGPLSIIRNARAVVIDNGQKEERKLEVPENQPYSRTWMQDRAQELRTEFYERGHPDAEVTAEVEQREPEGEMIFVDVGFRVEPGPFVRVGEIIFQGLDKTQEEILRRRVELDEGDALNRVKVEEGRFRLARLGIFDWVDVEFKETGGNIRDVIYSLQEGKKLEVNLLFGYGSYELARVGLEVEQYNIFGRAHRSRLLLAQSVRSSSINYRYTVPEVFGEDVHGFGTLFGLRREEPDFDRREFGASLGVQTFFQRLDLDGGLRYIYQLLESRAGIASGPDGLDRAVVSAVDLTLQRDLRDNPIYPVSGHNTRAILEVASETLGGEVDYQRLDMTATYHREIGRGLFIHAGLHHGILNTSGEVADEIPINRRFFTGGESSIRGYLEGEASPRNEDGDLVGSETYALLNLELEQALTQRWSVLLFSDSLGFARRLTDYPFDETLFSVGLGIRYKALIGPVRLEYGHNLNPRSDDPSGSLHLSIGFPF